MNTAQPLAAVRCWMQGRRVYLDMGDSRWVSFPTSKFEKLAYAPQEELEKIHLLNHGRTVGWDSIDEEIQVDDVAHQRFVHTPRSLPIGGAAGGPKP